MTGSLLQLKYIGDESKIFIGNPQIYFFKSVFKSYSNFGTENIDIPFIKTPKMDDFTQAKIPIHGDLINQIYLKINLNLTVTNYDLKLANNFTLPTQNFSLTNLQWLSSSNSGVNYEYDVKLNNFITSLYNYKYTIDESLFTNIDKNSFTISELNNNQNIVINLFNKINNEINLTRVTSNKLYVIFNNKNSQKYTSELYIKYINEDFTKFIKEISFEIDEYVIEKHSTKWLLAYNHYFNKSQSTNKIINKLTKITPDLFNKDIQLYIPLRFYFTKESQCSFPISSLYNSNVFIKLYTNQKNTIFDVTSNIITNISINSCYLATNFIYLDLEEKKSLLKKNQNLLIEQVQEQNDYVETNKSNVYIELGFTYLCKYLIWNLPYQYVLNSAKITFNNNDLFSELDGEYFNLIQPMQYNLGNSDSFSRLEYNKNINGTYYMYSFCLNPNENQPSGICNMSRIDNKFLYYNIQHIKSGTSNTNILFTTFAVNYNFLIINKGKCKLVF